jgi:uncharacterized protein affecting Mg2+/Co2+ transport
MSITRQFSITDIQDETRSLVARGVVGRQQRIFELSKYFDDRRWPIVEQLLGANDYLLRDRVIDLVGKECWTGDEG